MTSTCDAGDMKVVADQLLLDEWLKCNTGCGDASTFKRKHFGREEDRIDWMIANLPSLPYIVNETTNFIFSNGMTTGNEDDDVELNEWLYSNNIMGDTNYSVLMKGVSDCLSKGRCGIRYLSKEDGVINVERKKYALLVEDNEEYYGFKDIVGYIVSMCNENIYDIDMDGMQLDREALNRDGVIIDKDRRVIFLSKDEFLDMKKDVDGCSPLTKDRQRSKLLLGVYGRLNYDIEYDGPGRLIFNLKDGYVTGMDGNEVSANEIVSSTRDANLSRQAQAKAEAEGIARQIKESSSDNVIVTSDIFEDFEHLPRVTQGTQFLGYLENEGVYVAQIIGVQPQLFGIGKISGNISMEKLIDNAIINDIIPLRERFAIQISALLAEKLGFEKIYFDMYELKQVVDENDKRVKVVNMIEKLVKAGYDSLADKFAELLSNDLDESGGRLKKLKANTSRFIDKIKKIGKNFNGGNKNE